MNLTNVFIDILRSAMTQTSCDMIEGLSTQDWEKIYDISHPMMKIFISQEISLGRWMNFCRQRDL